MVAGMLMPLRDLKAIYEVLFRDGVMVAKKDKRPQIKHAEVQSVSNLQVIRAMGSLKSRGFVKETFAWRHFYWYLTNEGIVYLRDYLHLPSEIVPASLQRVRKPTAMLGVGHRATRVQSVEGPTSYVPKPSRRDEAESEEALADRHGYRHKAVAPGEKESYSDRTPRFRGRPLAAEPVRPKASWEVESQSKTQSTFRKGNNFRDEAAVMEDSRVKRATHLQPEGNRKRPVTVSQETRVFEVQKEKIPKSNFVQTAALKQDALQTTLTSVFSKTGLSLTAPAVAEATGGTASRMTTESSPPKTNKETPKVNDEKTFTQFGATVSSRSATRTPPDMEAKEEKTNEVIVSQITSAEIKITAERAFDEVQAHAVSTMAAAQKSTIVFTDSATKPECEDINGEITQTVIVDQGRPAGVNTTCKSDTMGEGGNQAATVLASGQEFSKFHTDGILNVITQSIEDVQIKKIKVTEESVRPIEDTIPAPGKPKIGYQKTKKNAKVTVTQETTKPKLDSTTCTTVGSTDVVEQHTYASGTSVDVSEKPKSDEVCQKTTTVINSSILEVKTTTKSVTAAMISSEEIKAAAPITKMITKQEKTDVKPVAHVSKDGHTAPEEAPKDAIQFPSLAQQDTSSPQGNQNVVTTELVNETKQVVEGSSKSKRKKKKSPAGASKTVGAEESPDPKAQEVIASKNKLQEKVSENIHQPTPPIIISTSFETAETPPVENQRAKPTLDADGEQKEDSHQEAGGAPVEEVQEQSTALALSQIHAVPRVRPADDAHVKEKVEKSSISKVPQTSFIQGDIIISHMKLEKPEKTTVTNVETEAVQKTQVEILEEKILAPPPDSQKPALDTKPPINTGKASEEPSKGKKKGRGKKQAKAPVSETINTKVVLPGAEASPSTDITSLPKATVRESPVMASELSEINVSLKVTAQGMCSEESRQATAVLSEAPADKGEVEPARLFAEKNEREVPKPKTSSSAREAPAAGESASAAQVVRAEAAAAETQASPSVQQEEPPRVAQHSATQAAERSTENRISVCEAPKQEEEKKSDLKEDTPTAAATPAAAQPDQPHLRDTCEPINSDTDQANMKRKIVVVEEIVEVKQLVSPQATEGQSSPPPVQPEGDKEELDLDVLEQLAIERALLSGVAEETFLGASPEPGWDHSLGEPEGKTWPNFNEGLFGCMSINPHPALFIQLCDVIALAPTFL